jgi:phenylacetate-CoA oxygenase PaaI subunit
MSETLKERYAAIEGGAETSESATLDVFSRDGRRAILALLVTLGDNKYMLGRRYSEWATSGPTLEASVAAASMTSDEVGHARSLYPLLKNFPDAPAGLKKEDDRTEFSNVAFLDEPFPSWSDFIAAAALFDRAMSTLIEALRESAYAPFRHRAAKMLQEEHYHRLYAEGWIETLARHDGTRAALQASLSRIWPQTLAWFGPENDPVFATAVAEKIVASSGTELRGRFAEAVQRLLASGAGLSLPSDPAIAWDDWDPSNRRLRGDRPARRSSTSGARRSPPAAGMSSAPIAGPARRSAPRNSDRST